MLLGSWGHEREDTFGDDYSEIHTDHRQTARQADSQAGRETARQADMQAGEGMLGLGEVVSR